MEIQCDHCGEIRELYEFIKGYVSINSANDTFKAECTFYCNECCSGDTMRIITETNLYNNTVDVRYQGCALVEKC